MLKILADETLPLLELFHTEFSLTTYSDLNSLEKNLSTHDILICRSTLKVDEALLKNSAITCVATASSGSDHIEKNYLEKHHITMLDAKGCNAHAVADYVCSVFSWISKNNLLLNQTAGVIGLGHVGRLVAERLRRFGLIVHEYDPPKAQIDPSFKSASIEMIQDCGLICLHPNLHVESPHSTQHLINNSFLKQLAPQTVLINASRGGVVDEKTLLSYSIRYCTDVYHNEPEIQKSIIDYATLCTPHIAGHTIEAKKNAVVYLATQLYAHFQKPLPKALSACSPIRLKRNHMSSMEDAWLSHYNPYENTVALKTARDKTQAFLALRKAHQFRHDIEWE